MCHMWQIFDWLIWKMHTHVPHMTTLSSTMWQGELYTYLTYMTDKYGCHIANIAYKANMLHGHIDLTYLHISTTFQPLAIVTSHVITKYVPEISMPNKWAYMSHYQTIWCPYIGEVCQYICHIWTNINHITRSTVHRH